MVAIIMKRSDLPTQGLFETVATYFERAKIAVNDFMANAKTIAELEAYSDRELDDIGVRRHDIARLVRDAKLSAREL